MTGGHSYCMGYEEVSKIEDKITNTPQNIVQEELNDGMPPYFTVVRRRLRIHVIFEAERSWASEGTSKAASQENQQGWIPRGRTKIVLVVCTVMTWRQGPVTEPRDGSESREWPQPEVKTNLG